MKLSELNDLWKLQKKQYELWHISLKQQAAMLRDEVMQILDPTQEGWNDPKGGRKRSYVELYDIRDKPQPVFGLEFSSKSYTGEGELIFGIAVTFEDEPHGPKKTNYMPVAVRFINRVSQFSFFDIKVNNPKSKWEADAKTFAETFVSKIVDELKFDPLDGPRNSSSIGFHRS